MKSHKKNLAICTISGDGTREGNQMTLDTSEKLAKEGYQVYSFHLVGKNRRLVESLIDNSTYSDGVELSSLSYNLRNKGAVISAALMSGLRTCIGQAVADGADQIIYMEGDKNNFTDYIADLARPLQNGSADVTFAQRSNFGWNQFPLAQRIVEGAANRYLSHACALPYTDFLYGPKGFQADQVVGLFNEYLENDWATITAPIVAASLQGMKVQPVNVLGEPQYDYLKKYPLVLRSFPGQLAWRTLQCLPLVKATRKLEKRFAP